MDKETYSISKIKNGILRTVLVRGVMKNKVGELENISSSLPGSILLFPLPLSIIDPGRGRLAMRQHRRDN